MTSQTETYIHILGGCQVCGYTPKSIHSVHSTLDTTVINPEEISKFFHRTKKSKIKLHDQKPLKRIHILNSKIETSK
jgi:Fe-S cluster biogenesis protein NfuA